MTSGIVRAASLAMVLFLSAVALRASARQSHDYPTWLEAVENHTLGEHDQAVTRLATWSGRELEDVVAAFWRQPRNDVLRLLERALVLHTDIAVLNRDVRGYNLPAGEGTTTLVEDGRAIGLMSRTVHWEVARRLLAAMPIGPERTRIGQQFYRATAAVLQQWGELPELTTHLEAGQRLLDDDPVLLLYEGTMHQALAGPRYQRVFDERARAAFPRGSTVAMAGLPTVKDLPPALPSVRGSRSQAERLFRRALAADPALVEARIRLAHVLSDAGRHAEAAAELKQVGAGPRAPFIEYYASLITGRVARTRGQLAAAQIAFERAAAAYPNAPAPRMALSELALVRGDRAASLTQVREAAPAERAEVDEPWWWLDRIHEPSALALIGEMRRTTPP
jgi:tetratricopeptide (TPR) repeat protein